jgi:chromosomal replication initiation ATPase DnaA
MSYAQQLAAERKARLERMQPPKPPASVSLEQYEALEARLRDAQALIAKLEGAISRQRKALEAFADKDRAPLISDVVAVVAKHFNKPKHALVGRGRDLEITRARHVAQYLCRRFGHSLSQIGRAFGRDHTSVLHGSSMMMRRADEPEFQATLDALEAKTIDYAAARAGGPHD